MLPSIKKSKELKSAYAEEKARRLELEKSTLSSLERAYLIELIRTDQVINSHDHGIRGLYSELNIGFLGFTSDLISKLEKGQADGK